MIPRWLNWLGWLSVQWDWVRGWTVGVAYGLAYGRDLELLAGCCVGICRRAINENDPAVLAAVLYRRYLTIDMLWHLLEYAIHNGQLGSVMVLLQQTSRVYRRRSVNRFIKMAIDAERTDIAAVIAAYGAYTGYWWLVEQARPTSVRSAILNTPDSAFLTRHCTLPTTWWRASVTSVIRCNVTRPN